MSKKLKKTKRNKHYKGWYRFLRGFLLPLGRFLFPTTVIGLRNLPPDDKFILAGNHRSWKDLPVLGFNVPNYIHYIAKEEFMESALPRFVFNKIGVITVNRQTADINFVRNVISALGRNEPIAIFPEGTRNKDPEQEMLELKNGTAMFAYKTGAAIVPFVIYKHPKMFKRNYVYIAQPFKLTDSAQIGIIDRSKLDVAALEIRTRLHDAMTVIDYIVKNKKAREMKKADKKEYKEVKKQRKLLIRQRKIEAKANKK